MILPLLSAAVATDTPLAIEVTNVRNGRGHVHVDICPESKFLKDDCPFSAEAPAKAGTTVVTVPGLPAGRYAAQVFHDENDNKKVDRALFGIPKEGVGFSHDAPIRMSPLKWGDAVFSHDGRQTITLRLRYWLGASGPGGKR